MKILILHHDGDSCGCDVVAKDIIDCSINDLYALYNHAPQQLAEALGFSFYDHERHHLEFFDVERLHYYPMKVRVEMITARLTS